MRKKSIFSFFFTTCLISFLINPCEGVEILFPPDLAFTSESSINIYGFFNGDAKESGTVNGAKKFQVDGDDFFSAEVELIPGLNLIEVGDASSRVFFIRGTKLNEYNHRVESDPLVFKSYNLHPALEEGCDSCHQVGDGDISLNEEVKELCIGCHDDPVNNDDGREYKFVHGPVAGGDCTACHNPHYSNNDKLLVEENICTSCHDDKEPDEGEYLIIHYPVKKGRCARCHSPHASPYRYQLKKGGNGICYSCHYFFHARHRSSQVRGKMTKIPGDFPVLKSGTLGCTGCHDPHFSENESLSRQPESKLCSTCHNM